MDNMDNGNETLSDINEINDDGDSEFMPMDHEDDVSSLTPSEVEPLADEMTALTDDVPVATNVETTTEKTAEKKVTPKAPPAYEAFITACQAHAQALGLSVKEQRGFYQFAAVATGHRLYVAKQGRGVTRIDTTLPRKVLAVNGRDISLPLVKPIGRIACHIDPTVESVTAALEILAAHTAKIDPPRSRKSV